jgi:hypothetical protein
VGAPDTYTVVGESIGTYLAATTEHRTMTLGLYRPLGDGRLATHISRQDGRRKRIAQIYIESGGQRDSLAASVSTGVRQILDGLILMLSKADGDLFAAMASIGMALQNQAAVLADLLLAGPEREAEARFRSDEAILLWLRQQINEVPGPSNDACAGAGRLLKDTGPGVTAWFIAARQAVVLRPWTADLQIRRVASR